MSAAPTRRAERAQAVANAVTLVPGVACLSPGSAVEAAVHYPGGKVIGVALNDGQVTVHVILDRLPIPPIVEAVRARIEDVLGSARPRVDIFVDGAEVDPLPRRRDAQPTRPGRSPLALL